MRKSSAGIAGALMLLGAASSGAAAQGYGGGPQATGFDFAGGYAGIGYLFINGINGTYGVNFVPGENILFGLEGYTGLGVGSPLTIYLGASGRIGYLAGEHALIFVSAGILGAPGVGTFVTLTGGVEWGLSRIPMSFYVNTGVALGVAPIIRSGINFYFGD